MAYGANQSQSFLCLLHISLDALVGPMHADIVLMNPRLLGLAPAVAVQQPVQLLLVVLKKLFRSKQ